MVYHAAEKNHLPQINQIDEFNYDTAVFRYLRQSTELSNLETLFEQEHISFVPLKGAVIRQWYPEAWMRTCTDIDILIHEADLEHAAGLLQDHLQYKREKTSGSHDISLYSSDQTVHLELHYSLLEEGRINDAVVCILNSVWDYVTPDSDGSSKGKMSDEMLYFYHIAHMAKHFIKGGNCGMRYLMDLWLLNQHLKDSKEKRDQMLSKAGLLTFAQKMSEIADGWFSPVQYSVDEQLEHYIIGSALHGSFFSKASYNYMINSGNKCKYFLRRVFPPRELLTISYPVVKKAKALTPLFWVVRIIRKIVDPKTIKLILNEQRALQRVEDKDAANYLQIIDELGLKFEP